MTEKKDPPLAVITGATKGIGRALSRVFAAGGFDLVLAARTAGDLAEARAELAEQYSARNIRTVAADLSQREGVDRLIAAVRQTEQIPEVLLNNVGRYAHGGLLEEPEGRLDLLMRLNVYAAYDLVRAFVPAMVSAGRGHIFNICSIASREAFAHCGAYLISKHALLGLTRALQAELKGRGVAVTAVLPGPTQTDSWKEDPAPPDGLMPPEAVAEAVWTAYRLGPAAVVEEILLRP